MWDRGLRLVLAAVTFVGVCGVAQDLPRQWELAAWRPGHVRPYLEGLQSADPLTRAGCVHVLARTGGWVGFDALLQALDDESVAVRGAVAHGLWGLAGWPVVHEPMVQAVCPRLSEEADAAVLQELIQALGLASDTHLGDPRILTALQAKLRSETTPERMAAIVAAISAARRSGRGDEQWLAQRVVRSLLVALGDHGPQAADALPLVRELTSCEADSIRFHAMGAVVKMGGGSGSELGELADCVLNGATRLERAQAAEVIGWLGTLASPVESTLAAALGDHESWDLAPQALSDVGISEPETVQKLVEMSRRTTLDVGERVRAVRALAAVAKPEARQEVAGLLVAMLEDEDVPLQLREPALWVLGRLGVASDEAVSCFRVAAEDDAEALRAIALYSFGRIAAERPDSIDVVLAAIDDPSPDVRVAAIVAAGEFGGRREEVLSAVLPLLDGDEPVCIKNVVAVCAKLGRPGGRAQTRLLALLREYEGRLRQGELTDPIGMTSLAELVADIEAALAAIEQ